MKCDACKYEGVETKKYKDGMPESELNLCEICASSMIGNMAFFPWIYPNSEIHFTIGWIGNHILKAIKESKP